MSTWKFRDTTLSLPPERCLILGIVNVTPDSFSDGGQFFSADSAVEHALALIEQGADVLDIGGESTRPGSLPVSLEEEIDRVVPVVEKLMARGVTVPLSIDTSKAEVARRSLELGAQIVNDVTGLAGDPQMVGVVREFQAGAIVMHMQGTPAIMQVNPTYGDVVVDIYQYFEKRVESLARDGIDSQQLVLDPGIGFGKTLEHNLELMVRLEEFQKLGRPICLGVSRKGTIGQIIDRPRHQRAVGGVTILLDGLMHHAVQMARVHDVAETRDALRMWKALQEIRVRLKNRSVG